MNILYIDPVIGNTDTALKYPYYNGLFSGFLNNKKAKIAVFKGIPYDLDKIIDSNNFTPDLVFFGLGWFGHFRFFGKIKNKKKIPIVVSLFKPQNDFEEKLDFCIQNKASLILTPVPIVEKIKEKTGIETFLFEYGCYFENFIQFKDEEKKYDVGFTGAMHESKLYPNGSFKNSDIRLKIKKILLSEKSINTLWKGTDNFSKSRIHDYNEYGKTINSCKIWLATLASHGDVTPRYYEVMSSNTLLFCEEPHELYKEILIDNYNCVYFNSDLSNFKSKLDHILSNDDNRLRIISNANQDSRLKNTWDKKAEKFINLIRRQHE